MSGESIPNLDGSSILPRSTSNYLQVHLTLIYVGGFCFMGNSQVFVICQNPACCQEFSKRLAEFNRSEKLGRPHFCSLKCHAQYRGLNNFKGRVNRDTSHLRDIIRRDIFSPFRYHSSAREIFPKKNF